MNASPTCHSCQRIIYPHSPGATIASVRVQFCPTCWSDWVAVHQTPAPTCYGCEEKGGIDNPLNHVLIVDEVGEFFHEDCKQTFLDLYVQGGEG